MEDSGAAEALTIAGITVAVLILLFLFTFATGFAPRWVLSWESYLVRLLKRKKRWSWTQIEPGLFLGSLPRFPCHLEELRTEGVGAVLSLSESWELGLSPACVQDCKMHVRHLPTPDFFAPSKHDIIEAVKFIEINIKRGSSVYVHCNGGRGRSAVVVICYLVYEKGWSPDEALQYVKERRSIAHMKGWGGLHKQWRAVKAFWRELKQSRQQVYAVSTDPSEACSPSRQSPDSISPPCKTSALQSTSARVAPLEDSGPTHQDAPEIPPLPPLGNSEFPGTPQPTQNVLMSP